jgi:hypothetical protein
LNEGQDEQLALDGQSGPQKQVAARATARTLFASLAVFAASAGLLIFLWFEAVTTAPVRDAVRVYTQLVAAANRGDLPAARSYCTPRYLGSSKLRLAEEGGIVGLPRSIHKNFRAWRQGSDVLLCPGNRVGPVYRLVRSNDVYRFDGLAGELRPGSVFVEISLAEQKKRPSDHSDGLGETPAPR